MMPLSSKRKPSFSKTFPCPRNTTKVMDANLLLFKTVIAGDSWGEVAVPVIQAGESCCDLNPKARMVVFPK